MKKLHTSEPCTRLRGEAAFMFSPLWASALSASVTACAVPAETNRLGEAEGAASNSANTVIKSESISSHGCQLSKVASDAGHLGLIFNDNNAPEKRLWANDKDNAPACIIAVPMEIPVGQKFEPRALNIRGYAHMGRLTSHFYWLQGEVRAPAALVPGRSNAYTFEEKLPGGNDADATAIFNLEKHELANLNSPTCGSQGTQLVTLVIKLQRFVENPHTHRNEANQSHSDALLALDGIDVDLGATIPCATRSGQSASAHRGERCGRVNARQVNCIDVNNLCVTSFEEQFYQDDPNDVVRNWQDNEMGTCVDTGINSKDKPANLVSDAGGRCAGPFRQRCAGTDQQLICTFKSSHPAESNDHYWGMCLEPMDLGEPCHSEWVRSCNQYECNGRPNPCKSGLSCVNNVCRATGAPARSADEDGTASSGYADVSETPANASTATPDGGGGDDSGFDWNAAPNEDGSDASTIAENAPEPSSEEDEVDTSGHDWDTASDEVESPGYDWGAASDEGRSEPSRYDWDATSNEDGSGSSGYDWVASSDEG